MGESGSWIESSKDGDEGTETGSEGRGVGIGGRGLDGGAVKGGKLLEATIGRPFLSEDEGLGETTSDLEERVEIRFVSSSAARLSPSVLEIGR